MYEQTNKNKYEPLITLTFAKKDKTKKEAQLKTFRDRYFVLNVFFCFFPIQ